MPCSVCGKQLKTVDSKLYIQYSIEPRKCNSCANTCRKGFIKREKYEYEDIPYSVLIFDKEVVPYLVETSENMLNLLHEKYSIDENKPFSRFDFLKRIQAISFALYYRITGVVPKHRQNPSRLPLE